MADNTVVDRYGLIYLQLESRAPLWSDPRGIAAGSLDSASRLPGELLVWRSAEGEENPGSFDLRFGSEIFDAKCSVDLLDPLSSRISCTGFV